MEPNQLAGPVMAASPPGEAPDASFRGLIGPTSEGMALLSADGTMLWVSPSVEQTLGRTPHECTDRNVRALVAPEDRERLAATLAAGVRHPGETIVVELTGLHKDGTRRRVECRVTNLLEEPRLGAIVAHFHDITAHRQTDQFLRFQAALLHAQSEASPYGILVVAPTGEVLSYNRRFVELWAIPEEVIATRSDSALIQAVEANLVDRAAFLARVAELYHRPKLESRDEIRLRDGRVFDRYGAPVYGDDGTFYGRVWFFQDVTERWQAEEGLARLAAIVASSDDAIISRTFDGTITTWNRGAERLYGYSAAEITGQSISCLLPPDRQDELPTLTDRLARGEQIPHVETVRLRKDGSRVDVSISLSPIVDATGQVVGISTIARDITERTRADANQRFLTEASTLLASSLDYEVTLAQVAHLAVPHLADWCIVYLQQQDGAISRLAMTHADPDKAGVARAIQERFTLNPDSADGIPHILRTGQAMWHAEASPTRLAADVDRPAELAVLLADLQIQSWIGVPLVARGRIVGAISFVTTKSGRRYGPADLALAEDLARRAALAIDNARLYRDAQEAIRARDQFLSIAAHELRNPLAVLKGAADLLRRPATREATEQRQRQFLPRIAHATDRLVELTDDLLDVSRLRLGQLPLHPERLDLTTFMGDLSRRHEEQIPASHRLLITVPGAPWWLWADAGRLEQVMHNLLDNAVKYSPDGGPIKVTVQSAGNGVLVQVRDEGIGLPPGAAEAIFAPFGRAANTGAIPGMGLGLFICRGIVEQHGGRIWAESAGEGCGTVMNMWLPSEPPGSARSSASPG